MRKIHELLHQRDTTVAERPWCAEVRVERVHSSKTIIYDRISHINFVDNRGSKVDFTVYAENSRDRSRLLILVSILHG